MLKLFSKLLPLALLFPTYFVVNAQTSLPLGSLEVSGRVKIEGKTEKLQRKRFYVLRGGLDENKNLIERLKLAESISRDCFYSQANASPQYICWLKAENCESPYCRQITRGEIDVVPEFQLAFQKGLRQFGKSRDTIAQDWLTTNLPPMLREGFYRQRETLLETILKDIKPLQSSMTDSVSVKAIFIDIPLNLTAQGGKEKKSETFLVSNLLPMEIGQKSYLWACELNIGVGKLEKLILKVPDDGKTVKDCEVIVKDLSVCKTEACKK
jgi:hypothetical protein